MASVGKGSRGANRRLMMVFPRTDGTSYGCANPWSIKRNAQLTENIQSCPICASEDLEVFLEIEAAPVHVGVVWESAESAAGCPRGDIHLAFCRHCGLIYNVAFDPTLVDYTLKYDNTLGFSPKFQRFERDLAERLVERHAIRNREVIELGAGSGRFLGLLCELGENRGTGFDPSHDVEHPDPLLGERASVVAGYYGEAEADRKVDLVCCRHMLEHLDEPAKLLKVLRDNLESQPGTIVYFEVPNAHLALREKSIWDVIYEHTSYYVPSALEYAFRSAGFEVLDVHECFSGQFAAIEARVDPSWDGSRKLAANGDPEVAELVKGYAEEFRQMLETWGTRLAEFERAGKSVALWGGGAKAVSFASFVDHASGIQRVVDINPGKQGSFLGGGGQPIVAPEELVADPPDVVVVMNAVYVAEIKDQLRELGLSPEVLTV
jgi:SAM-dependent methyltransferase